MVMFEFLLAPRWFKPLKPATHALCWVVVAALFAFGLYEALVVSPADYQQGETVRMMYVHVPAAWLSMGIYGLMALLAISYFAFKTPLAMLLSYAMAPIGACFTAITLLTGMLWGKPMWGAWWVWDARLTSVLLLFFLYLGFIALARHYHEAERGHKACAILSLVGAANLPVIKFSVEWWNTLHQPASVIRRGGIAIHETMQWPLFSMFAAYLALFLLLTYLGTCTRLLHKKRRR